MIKLILLYCILLTGMVFLIIPETGTHQYFLYSEVKMSLKTYVYFIFEKLILIVLAYLIASEEKTYRYEVQIFFFIMVFDFLDFMLTYNSIWFRVGFPMSMNILKMVVFGVITLRAWMRSAS